MKRSKIKLVSQFLLKYFNKKSAVLNLTLKLIKYYFTFSVGGTFQDLHKLLLPR